MELANGLAWLERRPDIESLRVAVCDLNGGMRGKRIPASQAKKALDGGVRMPLSVIGVDIWGEDIVGAGALAMGDGDGICEPTGRGLLPINWMSKPTALLPVWLADDGGAPYLGDPRRALAQVADRFAQRGLTPVAAVELEFHLIDPTDARPVAPRSPITGKRLESDEILSIDAIDHFDEFLNAVYESCAAQGVPADAATAENGAGQFEINLLHVGDSLRAADDAVLFKRIVRGAARKLGYAASFMAKPYGDRAGNGLHVHFSLIDRAGRNIFDDGSDQGAPALRHAVAGLLDAMSDSALVFAPHFNSYRRMRGGVLAPGTVAWGYENRTTAIRIPGGPTGSRRIEHRVSGADANPYLVLAAILGAALEGIEAEREPVDPVEGNAYERDLPGLPSNWVAAVDRFEQSGPLARILPEPLRRLLVGCKRQEIEAFNNRVTDFEHRTYLETV